MKKIPYQDSKKILSYFDLSDEAKDVVQDSLPPIEVIRVLQKESLNIDLATFIAHALPMRESIWWATLATSLRKADLSQAENKVIEDSASWVKQPNEALRRDIEKSIQPLANESSAKWLGQAVFWSGQGSIAPVENPVVMPADFLHAKAVAGAVNTAAALPEWSGYKGYYKQVITMALDIADGGSGKLSQEEM